MTKSSWRKALVAPAVLTLAFGGTILMAGPASAATEPTRTTTTAPAEPTDTTTTPAAEPTDTATTAPAEPTDPTTSAPTTSAPTTATPAAPTADPAIATFSVTTPGPAAVVTATTSPSTAVFSGQGLPTADTIAVEVTPATSTATPVVTDVTNDGSGAWTASISFPGTAPGATHVDATIGAVDKTTLLVDSAVTPVTVSFDFATAPVPAASTAVPTAVVTPKIASRADATSTGIALTATGFEPNEPLTFELIGAKSEPLALPFTPTPVADASGDYAGNVLLPSATTGGTYQVVVTGATSGDTAAATFEIVDSPTITSPTNGQTVIGSTVTFAGTGTPGSSIGVVALPTAEYQKALAAAADATTPAAESMAMAKAAATPDATTQAAPSAAAQDPATNIVVGADGTWSITVAAKPGDYTAVAIAGVVDANGDPVDANGDPVTADGAALPFFAGPSDPVEFVVAAAVVTTAADTSGQLAFTGSNATPAAVAAGLLLLTGAGLVVVAARRRRPTE